MTKQDNLKIDLIGLETHEGAMSERQVEWTVPNGWHTEVLNLPEGTRIPLDITLIQLEDGVLVQARGETVLEGHCVRCLDPVSVPMTIQVDEVFTEAPDLRRKHRKKGPLEDEIEVEGDELDEGFLIENNAVDISGALRDAIFADAPLQPVCDADCLGICEHCGVLLRDAEPGHHHEFIDPRFAALAALLEDEDEDGGKEKP